MSSLRLPRHRTHEYSRCQATAVACPADVEARGPRKSGTERDARTGRAAALAVLCQWLGPEAGRCNGHGVPFAGAGRISVGAVHQPAEQRVVSDARYRRQPVDARRVGRQASDACCAVAPRARLVPPARSVDHDHSMRSAPGDQDLRSRGGAAASPQSVRDHAYQVQAPQQAPRVNVRHRRSSDAVRRGRPRRQSLPVQQQCRSSARGAATGAGRPPRRTVPSTTGV